MGDPATVVVAPSSPAPQLTLQPGYPPAYRKYST